MKPETYWPQDKLYFYATCALFPERLTDKPLNSQQFNGYIAYCFSVDEQIKELEQLKQDGLLNFTVSRIDDNNAEYSSIQVNSDSFLLILKEYLKCYRNDELVGDAGFQPDTFAENNNHLMKYLNFSTRKKPIVNPINIWSNWNSSNGDRFPFWEATLAYHLIEARGKITDLGYSDGNGNSYANMALPFVEIEIFEEEPEQDVSKPQPTRKHKVSIILTTKGKLLLVINGDRTTLGSYKSEKNNTYRAARALYDAKGSF